ncbi:AraC family transcriptional regulator [Aquimarina brevivitae]|uniref:AraC family transcriptional regulator n=1 Tax=Aquimarina brevivitae TaxID=323412 RepID=A0A4Q7PGW3_9FLAO|nr:GyrI-like domain-containing protein [Aquimarina brevivitae]RZS99781.1 AraC family transcriptional regulator [Aquimarina brevivitae]
MTDKKSIQAEYINRINRVFEYIDANLSSDLSLETIAAVAFFSPYHFHRIFKYITTETLKEYVSRRRLEKSALDILHSNESITVIALKYGYSDNPSFTKAFKKYFGVSPTGFRKQNPNKHNKIRQRYSKNGQVYPDYEKYICALTNLNTWITMNAKIEIKEMPAVNLAYVTSLGVHNIQNAYSTLMQWATPQGLLNPTTTMITRYHDSFKVTPADKVRMSACLVLDKPAKKSDEVAFTTLEAGKCIVSRFEIGLEEFEKSWTGLFLWMNTNGYKKADRDPFEIYHNNFNDHPEKKAIVDLCIPVQ